MPNLEGSGEEDTEVTTETTSNPKFKWKIDGPSGHVSFMDFEEMILISKMYLQIFSILCPTWLAYLSWGSSVAICSVGC